MMNKFKNQSTKTVEILILTKCCRAEESWAARRNNDWIYGYCSNCGKNCTEDDLEIWRKFNLNNSGVCQGE